MNVSAIIVTRGDVHLCKVLASIPEAWEIIIWDNSHGGQVVRWSPGKIGETRRSDVLVLKTAGDLSVYGRYAAIEYASGDLIYVQDDDCVVSDPQAIVDALIETGIGFSGRVVCNMPPEFRHDFYTDHALVGFGACFHRDAPCEAFGHLFKSEDCINPSLDSFISFRLGDKYEFDGDFFRRTCDIVFTGLTPRVLVDVPYENLPWATAEDRMYRQPQHVAERQRMLDLVRQVRDPG